LVSLRSVTGQRNIAGNARRIYLLLRCIGSALVLRSWAKKKDSRDCLGKFSRVSHEAIRKAIVPWPRRSGGKGIGTACRFLQLAIFRAVARCVISRTLFWCCPWCLVPQGLALERRPACPLTRSCARNCCRFAARVRGVLIVSCRFLTVARVLACFAGASCSVSFTRYSCTSHARSMRDVTQQCENARETSRETSATAQVRNAAATRSEARSNPSRTNVTPKARGTPRNERHTSLLLQE
jgi:hypothetical protein